MKKLSNGSPMNFGVSEILPKEWVGFIGSEDVYVFNPAIAIFNDELILSCRVVFKDGIRRLALCRLDEALNVVPGSQIPLSDLIRNAGDWHADGRFFACGNRLFLHFNDGAKRPNQIYGVELDTTTLLPISIAKPFVLEGVRQVVEKNWLLYVHDECFYAVYSISPHVVLKVIEHAACFHGARTHEIAWNSALYSQRFGSLRGGTPPVRVGDVYYSFFHSMYLLPRWRRAIHRLLFGRGRRFKRYAAGFYGFSAKPPFEPVVYTPLPVFEADSANKKPLLNMGVDRVVYPCGAVYNEGVWTVSYGLNDEFACVRQFSHADLLARCRPAIPAGVA